MAERYLVTVRDVGVDVSWAITRAIERIRLVVISCAYSALFTIRYFIWLLGFVLWKGSKYPPLTVTISLQLEPPSALYVRPLTLVISLHC